VGSGSVAQERRRGEQAARPVVFVGFLEQLRAAVLESGFDVGEAGDVVLREAAEVRLGGCRDSVAF
jgi:hypothetical protein